MGKCTCFCPSGNQTLTAFYVLFLACSLPCRPLIYSCIGLATNRDVEDNRK